MLLPKIHLPKRNNKLIHQQSRTYKYEQPDSMRQEKQQEQQVKRLSNWSCTLHPLLTLKQVESLKFNKSLSPKTTKSKNSLKLQSIRSNKQILRQLANEKQFESLRILLSIPYINKYMQAIGGLDEFIMNLDNEIEKIKQIKYETIYRNIEYCSGIYYHAYNNILKILKKYQDNIIQKYNYEKYNICNLRQQHINKMDNIQYKEYIPNVRESIQNKEKQLKIFKCILKNIQNTKKKVLKSCLSLGFDVRSQGLVWILNQLGQIPKKQQFPKFLNDQEIQYIIRKYKNTFKLNQLDKQRRNCTEEQSNLVQSFEKIIRKKKRYLSMIKQNKKLQQFMQSKTQQYNKQNHNYLSEQTLNIMKKYQKQIKPKPTKYEIIYKQTTKKLNKIIIDQIYKRQNNWNKSYKRLSKHCKPIYQYKIIPCKQSHEEENILKDQNKLLEDILHNIRYQQSQHHYSIFPHPYQTLRKPITILCCLLGKDKALKLFQNQMANYYY